MFQPRVPTRLNLRLFICEISVINPACSEGNFILKLDSSGCQAYCIFKVLVSHLVDSDESSSFRVAHMLHLMRSFFESYLSQVANSSSDGRHGLAEAELTDYCDMKYEVCDGI